MAEILDQQRNRRMVRGESCMKLNFKEAASVKVTDCSQGVWRRRKPPGISGTNVFMRLWSRGFPVNSVSCFELYTMEA